MSPDGSAGGAAGHRDRVAAFFERWGAVFGMVDFGSQLRFREQTTGRGGSTHMAYGQLHDGIPVFGTLLRLHFDAEDRLTVVNGTFVPDISVDTSPTISRRDARAVAVGTVLEQFGSPGPSRSPRALGEKAYVFRTGLLQGVAGLDHLVYEVEVGNDAEIREFVYVDAHTGKIVDRISGIHDVKSRLVYDGTLGGFDPAFPDDNVLRSEGDPPTGDYEQDMLYEAAGATYDLFFNLSGGSYRSYDGADAILRSVWQTPFLQCPNASWNGATANYCAGTGTDDVVGHEWTHAYTQFTHGLINQWQSGALNEGYSDIFGETVDLLNLDGLDTPGGPRSNDGCSVYTAGSPPVDNSYRWLVSEESSGFSGAIRDMWNPRCLGLAGRVLDPLYHCGASDGGGVHRNSGIVSHGYALLVDGGVFNGETVVGIGLTKAAHIYWRSMSVYQVPATDFSGHADALEQSCRDLIGLQLEDLKLGGPSLAVIDESDCSQVATAMLALEMRSGSPPQCDFEPLLTKNPPPLCSEAALVELFADDFENDPTAAWSRSNQGVFSEYVPRDWEWRSFLPGQRSGSAFYGLDERRLGNCEPGNNDQSGIMHLDSPMIMVTPAGGETRLAFDHYVATEPGWDGGNVRISVNGGPWELIGDSAFSFNAYTGTLEVGTSSYTSPNPLAGQRAFTGTDEGVTSGSWGQSHVDLSAYVSTGDTFRLRFDLGVDGCNGRDGWYVDDVRVYTCVEFPCGDGVVDPGQECDDGNLIDGDGCDSNCTVTACGNGIVTPATGEQCDDGNSDDTDCCSSSCAPALAGTSCPDGDLCNGHETCDAAGSCQAGVPLTCADTDLCTQDACHPLGGCTWRAVPADDCQVALNTLVQITAGTQRPARLRWKWLRGSTLRETFGDPGLATEYALCFYDKRGGSAALAGKIVVPPSQIWAPTGPEGLKYKDKSGTFDGVTALTLLPGALSRAKITLKAAGPNLPAPSPVASDRLFEQDPDVTVQLINSDGGCWTSSFPTAKKNTVERFRAKSP